MKYVVDDKKLDAVPFIAFVNQVIICYKEVICSGDKRCHT